MSFARGGTYGRLSSEVDDDVELGAEVAEQVDAVTVTVARSVIALLVGVTDLRWVSDLAATVRDCGRSRDHDPGAHSGGMTTHFAYDTAIDPPTPPPTVAPITTIASMTNSQNVDFRRPQIVPDLFGTSPTWLLTGAYSLLAWYDCCCSCP